jgi:hypothetical protein
VAESPLPQRVERRSASIAAAALIAIVSLVVTNAPVGGVDTVPFGAVELLNLAVGTASGQPQLTSGGGRAILSWVEAASARAALRFAERTSPGWSRPRVVLSSEDLLVNPADVPSVRARADGTLAAHWLQKTDPSPEVYDLRVSTSKDDGRTWSQPVAPHRDGTRTQHGFASLFDLPAGALGIVWLDGRSTKPGARDASQAGDMQLVGTVLGADGRLQAESVVDPRVCDCCSTSAAVTSEGVIVAYRGRSADEVRDIHVARLVRGRWSAPALVHRDGWRIVGCPVNGPATSARGQDVAVAWFTVQSGQGRAMVAFSRDGGRTFGPPVRIDDEGTSGRLQVALLEDRSAVVSWIEAGNARSQLRVRRVEGNGTRSAPMTVAGGLGNQHPRMIEHEGELLFAWVESTRGTTRVRTARAAVHAAGGGR